MHRRMFSNEITHETIHTYVHVLTDRTSTTIRSDDALHIDDDTDLIQAVCAAWRHICVFCCRKLWPIIVGTCICNCAFRHNCDIVRQHGRCLDLRLLIARRLEEREREESISTWPLLHFSASGRLMFKAPSSLSLPYTHTHKTQSHAHTFCIIEQSQTQHARTNETHKHTLQKSGTHERLATVDTNDAPGLGAICETAHEYVNHAMDGLPDQSIISVLRPSSSASTAC